MALEDGIEELRRSAEHRDGFDIVPWKLCRKIALREGVAPGVVERAALEKGLVPSRYERSLGTLGIAGQARLLASRAAVVGCGGLGGLVVELLARAGVGQLVLIDGDTFSDNNLNRQILCTEADLGKAKALVAAERTKAVNGAVEVSPFPGFLDADNAASLLDGCGVAVDCLDNHRSRRILFDACARLGIPAVHGAIAGFWGQVGTVLPGDRTLLDFWGDQAPDKGVEVTTGNPPFTPALVSSLEAAEAVKVLLGMEEILRHRLLWFDLRVQEAQTLPLN
jgi:molybdopterin/thiamine biosynthesis adenylyltransferase